MNTDKWTRQIDAITADFQNAFSALDAAQLNWKPNAQTWSIAQIIHHLIVINTTYFPVFTALRQEAYRTPFIGKIGFMVKFMGKMLLDAVEPGQKRKMKTFPIWEPAASDIDADLLKRFEQHQSELKNWIDEMADYLDKGTVISSPANKYIVYKLETALDIIVTHERRHLGQAKALLPLLPTTPHAG
jgi:uncharacterized damage-inducible protein DinB